MAPNEMLCLCVLALLGSSAYAFRTGSASSGPVSGMGDRWIPGFVQSAVPLAGVKMTNIGKLRPPRRPANPPTHGQAARLPPLWPLTASGVPLDDQAQSGPMLLRRLCTYLCGDFDNRAQVARNDIRRLQQRRQQPDARHVTRVINDRIRNLPEGMRDGVFILEETDYVLPLEEGGGEGSFALPRLFYIEVRQDELWCHAYQFPASYYEGGPWPGALNQAAAEKLRNASPTLHFDFAELSESLTFPTAQYKYDAGSDSFNFLVRVEAPVSVWSAHREPAGLIETISAAGLQVDPISFEKDGQPIFRFEKPIEYRRI